jgi:hypothetical protein
MSEDDNEAGPRSRLFMGAVFVAAGAFMFLLGVGAVPSEPGAMQAPPWVLAMCGVAFGAAGALVAMTAAPGARNGVAPASSPFAMRAAMAVLPLVVIASLGSVGAWVAFGEGPRNFTSTTSVLGVTSVSEGDDGLGRFVFGAGAVLCGVLFIAALVQGWRKLFATPKD